MKTPLLVALLLGLVYYYYHDSATTFTLEGRHVPATAHADSQVHASAPIVIAAVPSYSERWKTGPNAQTDLKTGPNAQTDFAPFPPSEQATWNETCGYTIVSAPRLRIH